MSKKTTTGDETESKEDDSSFVDETPELRPSRQQERDHALEMYSTGYDPFGETRVGIGSAGGDVTKLIRHNEGRHRSDGNHSIREAARDKVRVTEAFCSALDIPEYQQRAAVTAIATMNLDRFGRQKRLQKVALATIKVVVEWDRFSRIPDEALPNLTEEQMPKRMMDQKEYRSLLDQENVSESDLYSVSQLVKRELKKHDHFPL